MTTYETFRPHDRIIRAEMAKILVSIHRNAHMFSSDIQLRVQNRAECLLFTDVGHIAHDLQEYVIQACQLGLMGYYSDGETVKTEFNPDETITIAEIATIFSRVLRGNRYK